MNSNPNSSPAPENELPDLEAKKGAQKLPNPKVCISSASASIDGYRAPPATSPLSSADTSVADATKSRRKWGTAGFLVDLDSSACSRTNVTLIDTSCSGWKSEKLILRKGATWKVRDKKVWALSTKKTKLGLVAKLVNEKAKEQPLTDPKDLAEDELLASLVEDTDSLLLLALIFRSHLSVAIVMVAFSNLIGSASFISTGL